MADEKDTIITDEDDDNLEEDKTSEEKNEEDKEEEKPEKEKPDRSDIAQKIKYREKYQKASTKVQELEAELSKLKGMDKDIGKKPADDAEARAQAYIRSQAQEVFEQLQSARKAEEEKVTRQFEEKVEEILEEHPDISKKDLLDTIEEYEVQPDTALKILKKTSTKKEKPKMPQSKRASTESEPDKGKPDDSKKTMWQILQEESAKLKK